MTAKPVSEEVEKMKTSTWGGSEKKETDMDGLGGLESGLAGSGTGTSENDISDIEASERNFDKGKTFESAKPPFESSEVVQPDQAESKDEQISAPVTAPPLVGPPPNGGLKAWLVVAGGFFALFNSWGVVNAFGSFQAYYSTNLLKNESDSAISWIGAIQGFIIVSTGIIVSANGTGVPRVGVF
ncbi:hypothetical protein AWJ20_221 [Sugiyamaella lignohabitans]|uniref:Uncharacterized protein n=1 Tax=Sugiyamaella lignohabitans TaxID=796027 RepID=A0A167CQQ9_9ASCO|nr:uncharacterized protein AWJ20_221 [Sugiyamaella lignohabitans]ANB11993.1 hypothetical protein AWJ20_221 [Sugiyamaella lignohabitans]